MTAMSGRAWLWVLGYWTHENTSPGTPIPMTESFVYNVSKWRTMGTFKKKQKTKNKEQNKTTHGDMLTYLWDHFGKTNQWVAWKNGWRASLLRGLCCQPRCWPSHSAPLTPAELALKHWWSRCRKQSSLCYGSARWLSPVSLLYHQPMWLNRMWDRCGGWKSLPPYLSCLASDSCFPQLKRDQKLGVWFYHLRWESTRELYNNSSLKWRLRKLHR